MGGNIKMDLKELSFVGADWIHLAQNDSLMAGPCEQGNELMGTDVWEWFLD
jgi:hypothetical protein